MRLHQHLSLRLLLLLTSWLCIDLAMHCQQLRR
jgi:hypothetical protein